MPRSAFATFLFCAVLAVTTAGSAAAASLKPVYKVDSVGASIHGRKLTIIVAGAVSSGGWTKAKLLLKGRKPESKTLDYEFVATPPSPDEAVIQALVPVGITFVTRLPPYGVTEIRVNAESNSATAKITR
ncbi:MAG TPA: hypothetical protein VG867_06495 [Rhizomicrobium sp.]|nr:hypothetical protein [Rhizomicrobium sp.]